MKKTNYTFILFFALVVLFASCSSSDDNTVQKSEENFSGICQSSILLYGYANQKTTSIESSNSLDNMLRNYNYIPPVTKGVFLTNTTVVEINGMKDGMVLNDFTLTMNDVDYSYGTITYRDTILYNQNSSLLVNYYKGAFDRMMQHEQQKQIASATFTPNQTIDPTVGIKVNITLGGAFTYWK